MVSFLHVETAGACKRLAVLCMEPLLLFVCTSAEEDKEEEEEEEEALEPCHSHGMRKCTWHSANQLYRRAMHAEKVRENKARTLDIDSNRAVKRSTNNTLFHMYTIVFAPVFISDGNATYFSKWK